MAKANVTKLDNGGYDVEYEGGGRVILNADEASSKDEAEKVASERLQAGMRVGNTAETETNDDVNPDTAKASAGRKKASK